MPVAGTRNTGLTSAAPLAWETNHRLPRGVAAVLAALRFSTPAPELLQRFSNAEWKTALAFTDRSGLTLILGALSAIICPPGFANASSAILLTTPSASAACVPRWSKSSNS